MSIISLVELQNSPDNNVRTAAELEFTRHAKALPSSVASELIYLSIDSNYPIDIRQLCLLHLKRLVPKYWSMGFQSFVGPPVDQNVKSVVRNELVRLATTAPESKLRNRSAYAIVQIASVDYPDEWPDLLQQLYHCANQFDNEISMIGGLTVLNDLFDDLVTEDQFWDGGIGFEVTNHIIQILGASVSPDIKSSALKLYQNVLQTLQSPEAYTDERKAGVNNHIVAIVNILIELLQPQASSESSHLLSEYYFRSKVYSVLDDILGTFGKRIAPDTRSRLLNLALRDLTDLSDLLHLIDSVLLSAGPGEIVGDLSPENIVVNNINSVLHTILSIQYHHSIHLVVQVDSFVHCLNKLSVLPTLTMEDYEADISLFVTEINGLAASLTTRDGIHELVSELNSTDANLVMNSVLQSLQNSTIDSKLTESNLFILECLFASEDSELHFENLNFSVHDLLKLITDLISYDQIFLTSKCFLVLPKLFEKFELQAITALATLVGMIDFTAHNDTNPIIRISSLISLTLYKNLLDLDQLLEQSQKLEVQLKIFQIVYSLIEDCEEDSLTSLLEGITVAIDIEPLAASKLTIADSTVTVIDMIFKISFKDSSNIQLTIDSSESLGTLLKQISIQEYMVCCEKSLPFIMNLIEVEIEKGTAIEYSPDLYLSLELLSIIIETFPSSGEGDQFPSQIFNYTFPTIKSLLLHTIDNQILQSGGEVFNSYLKSASSNFLTYQDSTTSESGMSSLFSIVSKFLSPELSDSAAMNCGLIVISFLEKFQSYLDHGFISQLLDATVKRLIIAKEAVTIENLIMVFCKLVLNSPEELVELLASDILVENPKPNNSGQFTKAISTMDGLSVVLPIWFESFEITRGYDKIKLNVLALGKIFTLNDPRVQNIIVNGDVIPYLGDLIRTRSMARSMPDQYTQISASHKIIKLLIGELDFQCQQPDANDYLPDREGEEDEGDGEGWEDMDDIGVPNYDKLKSYVDSDNEGDEYDERQAGDDSLMKILVQFFKECTAKNLGGFQDYYNRLEDNEKRTITENVVF